MKQKQGECEVTSFIIFKGKITRNAYRTPESFGNDTLPSDFPLLRPDTSAFRPSAETIPTQALSRGVPETQSFSIHSGKLRRSKLSEPATRKLRTSPRALFLETDSIMIKTQTDSIKSELLHSNSKVSKQKSKKNSKGLGPLTLVATEERSIASVRVNRYLPGSTSSLLWNHSLRHVLHQLLFLLWI